MFLHHFSLLPVGPLWELSPAVDSPAHGLATLSHTACNYIFLVVSATLCHQVNFIITFNAWLFLVVFSTCTLSYQVTFFHGFMFNHSWWFLPYLATRIWHQSSTCMNHKCQRIKLMCMWRFSHWSRELIKKYFLQKKKEMSVKEERALIKMMALYITEI